VDRIILLRSKPNGEQMNDLLTFEHLRSSLEIIDVPSGEGRRLRWIVADRLGVAKTSTGDFEIFLQGGPITTTSHVVRRQLEHGAWKPTNNASAFEASRIILPSAPHYASVAALIVTEFTRAGLNSGRPLQDVFFEVEPIIELAIRRGALPDDVVTGLFAELLVLREALRTPNLEKWQKSIVLGSWRGWQRGRDFTFRNYVLEVKATQRLDSTHAFSGLHQVEEQLLPDGETEVLHILSIGLQEVSEGGQSLPELVDDVLAELRDPDLKPQDLCSSQMQLLHWIEQYGTGSGIGYRHTTMSDWSSYKRRLAISFTPRLYRVRDSAMHLLRRSVVEETFVRADTLQFELALPSKISAFNPAEQWRTELSTMLSQFLASTAQHDSR
jgi:hypothetical protein